MAKAKINPKGVLSSVDKRMKKQKRQAKELGLPDPYKRKARKKKK